LTATPLLFTYVVGFTKKKWKVFNLLSINQKLLFVG
jgi:hypothetical protein